MAKKRLIELPTLPASVAESWLPRLEPVLADEPLAVRDALPLFLQQVCATCPRMLRLDGVTRYSPAFIRQQAGRLYALATTADELNCFQAGLQGLWEYYTAQGLNLEIPERWRPLLPEAALIDDSSLPLGLVDSLVDSLLRPQWNALTSSMSEQQGRWLLLIAWETGQGELARLEQVLTAQPGDWEWLQSPAALSLWDPERQRRLWLGPLSTLLGCHLQQRRPWPGLSARQAIESWLEQWRQQPGLPRWLRERVAGLRVEQVVRDISLLDRPLALRSIWDEQVALPPTILRRNWNGQCSSIDITQASQVERQRLPTAGNGSEDRAALRSVRAALSRYLDTDLRQHRNSRAATECRRVMEEAICRPLSIGLWLLLRWTLRMFTHGTPWRKRLATSTLLTYLSQVSGFLRLSFDQQDPRTLEPAALTACCQEGLDQMVSADAQRTVLRFLQYAQNYPDFPSLALDDLQLLTHEGKVRANYVSPLDFDACCEAFVAAGGAYERQMVLLAQLCFYAGLREDEALSLRCSDINQQAGLLYITASKRRKSEHAIRKIPLCLLPLPVRNALGRQVAAQRILQSRSDAPLFSGWNYAGLEVQWLALLRNRLQDGSLVTHSLRHSAANNWLFMLAMLCHGWQPDIRPLFLQHPLFDAPSLDALRRTLTAAGARLDAYFPVLDWISQTLGHSSPAVTIACYLHWLDWLAPQLTVSAEPIRKRELRAWVAGTSLYGFELQKTLTQPLEAPLMSLATLASGRHRLWPTDEFVYLEATQVMEWVARHWPTPVPAPLAPRQVVRPTGLLAPGPQPFSEFHRTLELVLAGAADEFCPDDIQQWLAGGTDILEPLTLAPQLMPAWQRLCQHLDTSVPSWSHLAWDGLILIASKFPGEKPVTVLRELRLYCHGLRALGLPAEKLVVHVKQQGGRGVGQGLKWQAVFEQHRLGWYPLLLPESGLAAQLRPYQLRWPLWPWLPAILVRLQQYRSYLECFRCANLGAGTHSG